FINILIFYGIDLFVFPDQFSFVNYLYPIAFTIMFQVLRTIIKTIYIRLNHSIALRKMKRK
ncbi:MAG TPA: hypothetical protein PK113_00595, partial [Bacillota bacterium]|nr:hypothetical protein [Bacillota bacterium]